MAKRFGGVFANLDKNCAICFNSLDEDSQIGYLNLNRKQEFEMLARFPLFMLSDLVKPQEKMPSLPLICL